MQCFKNDVLDLSKIKVGKTKVEFVPYNIRVEIDEALAIFDEKMHKKGVEVWMFKSMMSSHFVCSKIVFSIEDTSA